jgi:CheY-like chemotaxis protein
LPAKATTPRHVLLVDDNHDAAAALELVLQEMGHRTSSSTAAPRRSRRSTPTDLDCVFLDLGMPGIDGYEVARRVRANKALRHRGSSP